MKMQMTVTVQVRHLQAQAEQARRQKVLAIIEKYNGFTPLDWAAKSIQKLSKRKKSPSERVVNVDGIEYPFSMATKKGTILSSISSIANSDADKNYVLIKNIFEEPIEENFRAYLVNYKTKSIEEQFEVKTNYTNCIEISNKLIKPEIFLTTDKYLGIPSYVSVKNSFLSFEHTHPLHEYILSENKFVKITNLKTGKTLHIQMRNKK